MSRQQIKEYIIQYGDKYSREDMRDYLVKGNFTNDEEFDSVYDEISKIPPPPSKGKHFFILAIFVILGISLVGGGVYLVDNGEDLFLKAGIIDPLDKYAEYGNEENTVDEYKVIYSVDIGEAGLGLGNFKIGEFKKGDYNKIVTEIDSYGTLVKSYNYELGESKISCSKGGYFSASEEITCDLVDNDLTDENILFNMDNFLSNVEENVIEVSYLGEKEIADNSCLEFRIDVLDKEKFFESIEDDSLDLTTLDSIEKLRYEFCFEKDSNVALRMRIYTSSDSELVDSNNFTMLMGLEALSFDLEVEDSEFDLPVDYSVNNVICSEDKVYFKLDSFNKISQDLDIQFYEEDYDYYSGSSDETILSEDKLENSAMDKGDFKVFEFPINDVEGLYSIKFKVCSGDECTKSTCYPSKKKESAINCLKKSENPTSCESDSTCYLDGTTCEVLTCYSYESENACTDSSLGCGWSYGYCSPLTCYSFDSKESCEESSLECYWNKGYYSDGYCGSSDYSSLYDVKDSITTDVEVVQVYTNDTSDGSIDDDDSMTMVVRLGSGSAPVKLDDLLIKLDTRDGSQTLDYSGDDDYSDSSYGISYISGEGEAVAEDYLSTGDLVQISFTNSNIIEEGETATIRILTKNGSVKPVDLTTPSAMTQVTTYLFP